MSGIGSSDGYGATCGTFLTLYETVSLSYGLFYPFHGFLDLVFRNVPGNLLKTVSFFLSQLYVISFNDQITESWRYGLPAVHVSDRYFCHAKSPSLKQMVKNSILEVRIFGHLFYYNDNQEKIFRIIFSFNRFSDVLYFI